jgi:hypothetical protein
MVSLHLCGTCCVSPHQRADSVDEKAVYGDYAPKVDSVSGVLKANDKKPLDAYLVSKGEVCPESCLPWRHVP